MEKLIPINAASRLKATAVLAMDIIPIEGLRKDYLTKTGAQIQKAVNRGAELQDLGTKDGVSLHYIPKLKMFYLSKESSIIGILEYEIDLLGAPSVKNSYVADTHRGQGLGTVLYLGALHVLGKLHSSNTLSIYSVRVWRALSKHYNVRLFRDTYPPEEVRYKWGSDGIPIVDGKPINRISGNFFFGIK